VKALLRPAGVAADGHATAPEFRGGEAVGTDPTVRLGAGGVE
jgi:hypothetical protein